MKLPAQIAVPDSRDAITRQVQQLLRAADVDGIIPTPRDAILRCARLVESGDLDLESYRQSFGKKASGFLHKAIGKVFGFLDFRQELIYVNPALHPNKRNFVMFHEVTHKILDWQRLIYTEEDHSTVIPECKDIFESEANFGAADIMFQGALFEKMAADYNVSVASVLDLANRFEASVHASMRRFVERHREPCAVLVVKPTRLEHENGYQSYVVCYPIASTAFLNLFGMPFSARFLNPGDQICDILNKETSGSIILKDIDGKRHECIVEPFNSGYSTFALLSFPPGKRQRKIASFK